MTTISYQGLALAMLPTVAVLALMVYWSADAKNATYASLRMLAQLLLIGYVLVYIFETDQPAVIIAVLVFMICVSSWIATPAAGFTGCGRLRKGHQEWRVHEQR